MALNPAFGMRGTGSFDVTGERPQNYRESLLRLYPNGDAPLTAILAKLKSEQTDDPTFHWYTKKYEAKAATFAAGSIYTDALMASAYVSGGITGDPLFVKSGSAFSKLARIGHMVVLRKASDHTTDVLARVVDVQRTGVDATSYVAVELLEADDNSSNGFDLSDADTVFISGNINAEGGTRPEAISFKSTHHSNNTQIFRTAMDITRTARLTKYRTGEAYKELKRETLEVHSCELEDAFIWGKATEVTGSNGQPERTTQGIVDFIRTDAPTNVLDYKYDATYTTQLWTQGGKTFMDNMFKTIFKYGKKERIALVGNGALLGIQQMVEANTLYHIEGGTIGYGIEVLKLTTVFGKLSLILAPRFAVEDSMSHSMLVLDTSNLIYRYITDTMFKEDKTEKEGGGTGVDGTREEFLTECGLEMHHPELFAYITGIGENNLV